MSPTDESDWEEYFEDYVRKHPEMPFTKVVEHITQRLGITIDEILSDIEANNVIDSIWDTGSSAPATELIETFTTGYNLTVSQLLSHPVHGEAINTLYKKREPLKPDNDNIVRFSGDQASSISSQTEREQTNGGLSTNASSPSGRALYSSLPSANAEQSSVRSLLDTIKGRTSADRVAGFVVVPILVARVMDSENWRGMKVGIHAVVKQVAGRLGQAKFRQALFDNYGCRCLITGCTVAHVIEAAHIRPYKSNGAFDVKNGLLLRSDLHMLFDQNLLTFHPENRKLILSPRLKGTDYQKMVDDEEELHIDGATFTPDPKALQERYDAFMKAQDSTNYTYAEHWNKAS